MSDSFLYPTPGGVAFHPPLPSLPVGGAALCGDRGAAAAPGCRPGKAAACAAEVAAIRPLCAARPLPVPTPHCCQRRERETRKEEKEADGKEKEKRERKGGWPNKTTTFNRHGHLHLHQGHASRIWDHLHPAAGHTRVPCHDLSRGAHAGMPGRPGPRPRPRPRTPPAGEGPRPGLRARPDGSPRR